MKKQFLVAVLAIGLLIVTVGLASALVLDFEGQGFGNSDTLQGSGYGGFAWDSNIYSFTENTYNSFFNNNVDFTSGDIAVFNGAGYLSVAVSNSNFSFNGAYFTSWSQNDADFSSSSTTISMIGYLGGSQVGSVTYDLTNDFQYYSAEFDNVDSVVFQSSGASRWWLMDNMTVNENNPVPEPTTMLLFGTGLLGLIGYNRKRFNKKSR